MVKASGTSAGITEVPEQTEERQRTPLRDVADMPVEDLRQLLHELQVRQTELEAQNKKLHQARTEGCDFSPVGQLTLDTHGKIVGANLRAAKLVGIDRDKLIGQPFIRFVAQDSQDIFHWHSQKIYKTGARQSCEMQVRGSPARCSSKKNPALPTGSISRALQWPESRDRSPIGRRRCSISASKSGQRGPCGLRSFLWNEPLTPSTGSISKPGFWM